MDVTLTIRCPGAMAATLVQALESEGVSVDWTPPEEDRGLGTDIAASLIATGTVEAIKAIVTKMRGRMPHAEIVIENDPDDAHPLTQPAAGDATPETIAQWMFSRLNEDKQGRLYQSDAVTAIAEQFGDKFTYTNDNGNSAIDKRILKAFRKITDDMVVWERWDFC